MSAELRSVPLDAASALVSGIRAAFFSQTTLKIGCF